MTSLLTLFLLFNPGEDPRARLVLLQSEDRAPQALEAAREMIADDPSQARELGVDYLEGRLLDRMDRPEEAVKAYIRVMRNSPSLRPYALMRIAESYVRSGHPELAAGQALSGLNMTVSTSFSGASTSEGFALLHR